MRVFKMIIFISILLLPIPSYSYVPYCSSIKGADDLSQFHIAVCKGDVEVVKKYNIRVIGPNCMGIFVPKNKISFSGGLLTDEYGNFGGIFQSGGLAVYISAKGQSIYGTYPSKILSIGNQIDLNFVDFLEYFLEDDETNIIALYVENIKSQEIGKKFIKIVIKS